MSLHDLIYSQQDETASAEEPPKTKRPKREKSNVASLPSPRQQEQDNDLEALNRFYGIESTEPNPSPLPPTISSKDHVAVKRRRKRKRGRPKSRRHQVYDDEEEEELWETQSEALERISRTSQKTRYKEIKNRWKAREFSLQDEVDYGNAVQHMARKVMKRSKSNNNDRKPAAAVLPDPPPEQQQQDDDVLMNSSDEEQQAALGSLYASLTQQDDSSDDDDKDNKEPEKPVPVDYGTWDYHQLGYDVPRKVDLQAFYYNHHKSPFQLHHKARAKRLQEMEAVTFTPETAHARVTREADNERYYLDMDSPTTCHSHFGFFHACALRAVAARCLLGSDGRNEQFENRLLRDLYSAPCLKTSREYHVMTQAMERGAELVLFQSNEWKQRQVAARILGITPECHHAGPSHGIGYSLERKALAEVHGLQFRNRVVRLLSNGQVPYEYEQEEASEAADDSAKQDEADVRMVDDEDSSETSDVPTLDLGGKVVPGEEESPEAKRAKLDRDDTSQAIADTVKPSKPHDPNASSYKTFLGSQVDYVHQPGTQPPVPPFPLDESGVVLGGVDPYSRVYHNAKIDTATFNMTLSVLLSRLGRARLDNDTPSMERIQDQIRTFMTEAIQENVKQLEKFHFMRRKRTVQPSASQYRTMMGLCSYAANSGATLGSVDTLEDDDDDNGTWGAKDDSLPTSSATTTWSAKTAAEDIHNQCADCTSSSSLTIFPQIHVTTGIALIAKNLPESAAKILSRPFDDHSLRTPFELMRTTLEYLEENHLLVDTHRKSGTTVSAGYLEHAVHQATGIIRYALEIDPSDMVNQAWYVSGLAASMLLCSGNAIDSQANLCPSAKVNEDYDAMFSQPDEPLEYNHQVRKKMQKFDELRTELAVAIKNMVQMARKDKTAGGDLIVSSALEWRQAIALVVGPNAVETRPWADIRQLHSHFAVPWALSEGSPEALVLVEDMARAQDTSSDNVLKLLASAVENDPSDIQAWRHLVQVLGPVGKKVSPRRRKECKQSNCTDCKRLSKGLNIDHELLEERLTAGTGWWGHGRTSFWDKHVIAIESNSPEGEFQSTIFSVSQAIEKRLSAESIDLVSRSDDSAKNRKSARRTDVDGGDDLTWLNDAMNPSDDSDSDKDSVGKADSVEHLLPMPFDERVKQEHGHRDLSSSIMFGANGGDERLELFCLKIVVTCHLYGVSDTQIVNGIWELAQKCHSERVDSEEWKCLLYLSSMGLNVPQILYDLYTQVTAKETKTCPYPPLEKEAMRMGVEIFGTNQLAKIRDYFDIFKDKSRYYVSNLCKAMKAYGEL